MCTHLFRREGGTYYFRRAIPLGKRSQFGGRREWIVSLRTKDRAEAKRLIPRYVQAFDRAMLGDATGDGAEKPLCGLSGPIPVIAAVSAREASKGPVWAPVPLLDTFDAYVREQGIKAVTANEWRGNLRALVRHVGHDDAACLTVENIDSWRDFLLAERTKRGVLRSPRTVKDKYISALRSTLNYAISKRKLTQNVAAMVDVRVPRKAKLRERDFTSEEAKAILSETMKVQEDLSTFVQRARRWIPWLCAYTGARVNEISQLRGSDVVEVNGILAIHITPVAGTVKSGQARVVPLHPHLIEQGFPRVAKRMGDQPMFYDPGKVRKPGPGNRHIKKVGEMLATWVRSEVGINDPGVQPNHGWRHLFKSRCVEADIPERIADAIQGHAARSVGQSYGSVSLVVKSRALSSMRRIEI